MGIDCQCERIGLKPSPTELPLTWGGNHWCWSSHDGCWCGQDWCGRGQDWCGYWGGNGHWSSHCYGRCGRVHWGVVTNLRLERVAVDIGGLTDDLVTDVGVADDGISGLDSLQDGGGRGDRVHGRRLRDQALAVNRCQSRHCRYRGYCGERGRQGWYCYWCCRPRVVSIELLVINGPTMGFRALTGRVAASEARGQCT